VGYEPTKVPWEEPDHLRLKKSNNEKKKKKKRAPCSCLDQKGIRRRRKGARTASTASGKIMELSEMTIACMGGGETIH
jgi:hypothetical protein